MISKNELKYIQSLYHKKTRDKEKVFIVEGPKMVAELLQSPLKPLKIFTVNENWVQQYPAAPIELTTADELARISHLTTAHEILAIVQMPTPGVPPPPNGKLILALDAVRDPGNMGTLIRIADWFGVDAIVASHDAADIFNPKVVQASMGSLYRIPVYYTTLDDYLSNADVPVYGALLDGTPLGRFSLPVPVKEAILVIGNESAGIGRYLLPHITQAVKIPGFGAAESLNAAVAAAVLLGHLKIPHQSPGTFTLSTK